MYRAAVPGLSTHFEPFTTTHAVAAGAGVLCMAVVSLLGRRWRGTEREIALRRAWVAFVAAGQAVSIVWWLLPANFNPARSFPLHMCDLVGLIAIPALLTERRLPRALLYFWGLGLSSQAFFTPIVREGPALFVFWLFWLSHTQIVGSAVYDVVARCYRPLLRDLTLAVVATLTYTAVMLPFDVVTGFNYGYLGRDLPGAHTLMGALGPWPWRLLAVAGLVFTVFALMWLAWPAAAGLRARLQRAGPR